MALTRTDDLYELLFRIDTDAGGQRTVHAHQQRKVQVFEDDVPLGEPIIGVATALDPVDAATLLGGEALPLLAAERDRLTGELQAVQASLAAMTAADQAKAARIAQLEEGLSKASAAIDITVQQGSAALSAIAAHAAATAAPPESAQDE